MTVDSWENLIFSFERDRNATISEITHEAVAWRKEKWLKIRVKPNFDQNWISDNDNPDTESIFQECIKESECAEMQHKFWLVLHSYIFLSHVERFIWKSAIFMLHFCEFENSCRDFTNYFLRCIPQITGSVSGLLCSRTQLNTGMHFCSVKKIHFALTWVRNSILCHFKTQTQINEQKHLNDQFHCEEAEWFITQDHSHFH